MAEDHGHQYLANRSRFIPDQHVRHATTFSGVFFSSSFFVYRKAGFRWESYPTSTLTIRPSTVCIHKLVLEENLSYVFKTFAGVAIMVEFSSWPRRGPMRPRRASFFNLHVQSIHGHRTTLYGRPADVRTSSTSGRSPTSIGHATSPCLYLSLLSFLLVLYSTRDPVKYKKAHVEASQSMEAIPALIL